MSISEERMMILKMVQEGRISSDEAAKLLEALDQKQNTESGSNQSGPSRNYSRPQRNYYDEVAKCRERISEWKNEISKNYNQKDFDKMVDDFSAKAEKIGKDVTTATLGVVDKVVDFVGSFVDTGAFNIFGSCATIEKIYEAPAAAGADLILQATNGQIFIRKHDEEKIIVKAKIRTPQANAENVLTFINQENVISLRLAKPDTFNLSVSYEVFVPAVKLNKLLLETKNSKISVEDTISAEFICVTRNGAIDLMGVNSDKITAETKNAKVTVNYLIGREIKIDTQNSIVEVKNVKAEKLGASSVNGKVMLENLQQYNGSNEINLTLKTKNADIKANMNDSAEDTGYKVSARTSNGGINLLIPNLLYRNGMRADSFGKQAEAETENYAGSANKVNIVAETQNGYIEIIK